MQVLYDSIDHVDISSSGTVVAQLLSPPLCHESLQIVTNYTVIQMTIMISPQDVEHFVRILRARGMVRAYALQAGLSNITQTNRIKLNGTTIRKAATRSSVNVSPTRLEFGGSVQNTASYQVRQATSDADWLIRCQTRLQ
jgi:hypothetical protein